MLQGEDVLFPVDDDLPMVLAAGPYTARQVLVVVAQALEAVSQRLIQRCAGRQCLQQVYSTSGSLIM